MKKTILVLLVLMIGLVTAQVITNMNLNLDEEAKDTLLRVGDGIGTVQKIKEICNYDNETEIETCINETYIDVLQLLGNSCSNGYCYFTLYEENSINKEFKIELERICAKDGVCTEEEEEYECCLIWRAETDEEVLAKARIKTEETLNHIADVTLDREAGSKAKRFEDVELII